METEKTVFSYQAKFIDSLSHLSRGGQGGVSVTSLPACQLTGLVKSMQDSGYNLAFTYATIDLKVNWKNYRDAFIRGDSP